MKVQMEAMLALTAVMVVALAISSVSDVHPTSMDKCGEELIDIKIECGFVALGADNGPSMCCNGTSWLYKNDIPCFCYYHSGTSDEDIQLVLAGCGINTGGSFSCSAPPANTTPPPPPAVLSPPSPPAVLSPPSPLAVLSPPPASKTPPPPPANSSVTPFPPQASPPPPPTSVLPSPPVEPPGLKRNPPPPSSPPKPTSAFPPPPTKPSPTVLGPNTSSASAPLPISILQPPPGTPVYTWHPPNSAPSSLHSSTTPLIVGVISGSVAVVIVVLGILFVLRKRSRRTMRPQPPTTGETHQDVHQSMDHAVNLPPRKPAHGPALDAGVSSTCTFTYKELKKATNGFSTHNILGEGGFGYVYKGILPNATEVAVKLLKPGSWQGEREFQTEIETISRVHHRNLISLVGYSNKGNKKILVYAFVPNKTLEFHLHGSGQPVMEWSTRMKIAIGSAKGLAYLHEDCYPTIVHRDVKASNILLDFNFEPKVADFGLAKFFCDNITHVTTRVVGTFGYLAPEYAATGKLTDKSDVFSFGVILLELITGRHPVDKTSSLVNDGLVEWAMPLLSQALNDGNCDELVDEGLQKNYDPFEMSRMIACATACLSRFAQSRPRMSQVVRMLEGEMSLEDHNYGFPGNTEHLKEQNRVERKDFSNEASVDSEKTRWSTSSNFTRGTGKSDRNTTASSSEIRSVDG